MKDHFIKLFRYNHWANQKYVEALAELNAGEDLLLIFSHTIKAQALWYSRVVQQPDADIMIWKNEKLKDLDQVNKESTTKWIALIEDTSDFDQPVSYANTKGSNFSNQLEEILTHVVNHGSYHRAQLAKMIRAKGIKPPATDYIVFVRSPQ